jgi:putative ABC transport system substrate-binding protein
MKQRQMVNIPGLILDVAAKQSIPTMFRTQFFPEEHEGLASYGVNEQEMGRQAARIIDKIIKGVKPAEIPVEVNSKIEMVINLKTAKKLGLTIPPEMLFQADKLIR